MARQWPKIKNFELFHHPKVADLFYVRMAGEGSINAIFIQFTDTPLFTKEGMVDATDGPYRISIGLSKGTSSGVVAEVRESIEEIAEKLNAY